MKSQMNRSYIELKKSVPLREKKSAPLKKGEELIKKLQVSEREGGREHKYLQTLIRKWRKKGVTGLSG